VKTAVNIRIACFAKKGKSVIDIIFRKDKFVFLDGAMGTQLFESGSGYG